MGNPRRNAMRPFWNSVKSIWQRTSADEVEGETNASGVTPESQLGLLRDVKGVVGSVAISPTGRVFASDLPRIFDAEAMERLATRIVQLHAAMINDGGEFVSVRVVFEAHELHIEPTKDGLMGVLTRETVDRAALRVAMRLVARRMGDSQDVGATIA